eukprot:TRINITY_DN6770_c0_g1_i2.p1 TRINITY_DN6770_c0_g1~~TRINITY_DN6770_c0_g1_i2.p1  ORF type:complete len:1440 (+),score=435.73 TRINITY_DN6770_c0_g1_i2:442-4320(+)
MIGTQSQSVTPSVTPQGYPTFQSAYDTKSDHQPASVPVKSIRSNPSIPLPESRVATSLSSTPSVTTKQHPTSQLNVPSSSVAAAAHNAVLNGTGSGGMLVDNYSSQASLQAPHAEPRAVNVAETAAVLKLQHDNRMLQQENEQAVSDIEILKQQVAETEDLLQNERKARSKVEEKYLELQSASTVRIMEGKIAGLQSMLEDKVYQQEQIHAEKASLEGKINSLETDRLDLQHIINDLETRAGHSGIAQQELQRQLDTARSEIKVMENDYAAKREKWHQVELQHQQEILERDRNEDAMNQELRTKNRIVQEIEMEKASQVDQIHALQSELDALTRHIESIEKEKQTIHDTLMEAHRDVEIISSESEQRKVVTDGIKEELQRESEKVRSMLADLRSADNQRVELENRLRATDHEVSRLLAVEENSKYLTESLTRTEEDLKNESANHTEARERIAELENRLKETKELQFHLQQAEAEVAAKNEAIERMHGSIERNASETTQLQQEISKGREVANALQNEVEAAREHAASLSDKMVGLEMEAQRCNVLEGKIRMFEELLERKTDELRVATTETTKASMAARELQHRLGEIPELERKVEAAQQEHNELLFHQKDILAELQNADARVKELESHIGSQNATMESDKVRIAELEGLIQNQQHELAEGATLHQHIADLEAAHCNTKNDLEAARNETASTNQEKSLLQHELDSTKSILSQQQERVEQQLAQIETLQVESGKQLILLQEREKDHTRMVSELEQRSGEINDLKHDLRLLKEEFDQLSTTKASLEEQNATITDSMDTCKREMLKLKEDLSLKTAQLSTENEKSADLQVKVVSMEADAVKSSTLEGKIAALQEVNESKTKELESTRQLVNTLKEKLEDANAEAELSSQLEARIKDLRTQVSIQLSDLERLEAEESRKAAALIEAKKELDKEVEKGRSRDKQLEDERARSSAIQERLQRLEAAAAARSTLEGKLSGLEILAESKESELRATLSETGQLRQKVKELEGQLSQRARVEDVIQEAQTQLQIKNDTIARLEKDELKRRGVLDEQYKELISMGEKVKQLEVNLQSESMKRVETEARLKEVIREGEMRIRAEEGETRERDLEVHRLTAEVREARDKLSITEKHLRLHDCRISESQEESNRLRIVLAKAEEEKGSLSAQAADLKRQLEAEKSLVAKAADYETEIGLQREREDRSIRSIQMACDQKLREERSRSERLEKEILKLKEELAFSANAHNSMTRGRSYETTATTESVGSYTRDFQSLHLRDKADNLAAEWERTKESVARLQSQLKSGKQ